jgi:hypothetical protein
LRLRSARDQFVSAFKRALDRCRELSSDLGEAVVVAINPQFAAAAA